MVRILRTMILVVFGIVGASIAVYVLYIIATLAFAVHNHDSELRKLRLETKEVIAELGTSNYVIKELDCHDVELRNECYVTVQSSLTMDSLHNRWGGSSSEGSEGDSAFERQSKSYANKKLYVQYGLHQGSIEFNTFYND